MNMKNVYDLAVIGAGPAGIVGATTAASLGARVAFLEPFGDLGRAGANTGTVPSKTLRENGACALWHPFARSLWRRSFTTARSNRRRPHAARARGQEALNRTLAQIVEASVELIVGDAHLQDSQTIGVRGGAASRLVRADIAAMFGYCSGSLTREPSTVAKYF
jgi:NAD(P) transhydrogenase